MSNPQTIFRPVFFTKKNSRKLCKLQMQAESKVFKSVRNACLSARMDTYFEEFFKSKKILGNYANFHESPSCMAVCYVM